ncbi:MAG: serine protease [Myxococcota bacterium]
MFAAILGYASLAASPLDPEAILDAVVVVQQGSGTCAGVLVDETTVATAYHCVAGGFGARVTTRTNRSVRARVSAIDVAHDLALLTLRASMGPALAIATDAPQVGAVVHLLGHPYAASPPGGFLEGTLRYTFATGTVAAVGTRSLQINGSVAPGFSGGPVVDEQGAIVGIVSRRIGDAIGFAGRAEALQHLRETPRRTALGGMAALSPSVWTTERTVVGLELEVNWRERLVFGVQGGAPLAPRTGALLDGVTESIPVLARLGLRQPIGRFAVDAFAAAGWRRTWFRVEEASAPFADDQIDTFVGAGFGQGGFRFEVARRMGAQPTRDARSDWLFGLRLGLGALRRVW